MAKLESDYNLITSRSELWKKYTFTEILCAYYTIGSRLLYITAGKDCFNAIIPLADMLNHSERCKDQVVAKFDTSDNCFKLTAAKPIHRTEEICKYYLGHKSNTIYLMNYGFCIQDNPVCTVYWKVEASDKGLAKRLGINFKEGETKYVPLCFPLKETMKKLRKFMSYMRLLCADEKILGQNGKVIIPAFSVENEAKALAYLLNYCQKRLAQYPSSIDEDNKLLEERKSMSFNESNCIIERRDEKIALTKASEMCMTSLKLLNMKKEDAISTLYASSEYKEYFEESIIPLLSSHT